MTEADGLLSEPAAETKWQAMRRRARDMVEGEIDTWFEYSLLLVIFGNVLALVVSSVRVPSADDWCAPPFQVMQILPCGKCITSLFNMQSGRSLQTTGSPSLH